MTYWRLGLASLVVHAVISFAGTGEVQPLKVQAGDLLAEADSETCELLVFLDPACPTCRELLRDNAPSDKRVRWISDSDTDAAALRAMSSPGLGIEVSPGLFAEAGVSAVPAAVLRRGRNVVMAGGVSSTESFVAMLDSKCGNWPPESSTAEQ